MPDDSGIPSRPRSNERPHRKKRAAEGRKPKDRPPQKPKIGRKQSPYGAPRGREAGPSFTGRPFPKKGAKGAAASVGGERASQPASQPGGRSGKARSRTGEDSPKWRRAENRGADPRQKPPGRESARGPRTTDGAGRRSPAPFSERAPRRPSREGGKPAPASRVSSRPPGRAEAPSKAERRAPGAERTARSAERAVKQAGRGLQPRAAQAGRLPGPWRGEIEATAKAGSAEQAISLVSQALEAFLDEDFTESSRLAEAAKSLAPRSGRIAELLGLAYYHAGRWKDALRELLAYRRVTGLLEQNHVIADCYRALGRPDRALEVLSEVSPASTPPDVWAETMIVAAGALADKGQIDRALAALARTDLNPESVEPYHLRLWYVQADLLERAGRRAEAIEGWRSIVAEDPDFFDAVERLSRLKGSG